MLEVQIQQTDTELVARLRGEIDHHAAGRLREEIDSAISAHAATALVLDFSGITFMDSSGIGLILGRYRLMQQRGGSLRVRGASERQLQVMKMAGLEKLQLLERTNEDETDQ